MFRIKIFQNMLPVCNKAIKKYCKKMWQSNSLLVLNTKCYVWGKSNTTQYLVPLSIFSSILVTASYCGYAEQKGAKLMQNPRGKPGSVCFLPDTGR